MARPKHTFSINHLLLLPVFVVITLAVYTANPFIKGWTNLLLLRGLGSSYAVGSEAAVEWYEQAARVWSGSVTAHRLLGAQALRDGSAESAIPHYQHALAAHPDNQLLLEELALAYDAAGLMASSRPIWQKLGMDATGMAGRGMAFLQDANYHYASLWLESSLRHQESPARLLVDAFLFSTLAADRQPSAPDLVQRLEQAAPRSLYRLTDGVTRIEAEEFVTYSAWPGYGLQIVFSEAPTLGVLWSSGYCAYTVVAAGQQGVYRVSIAGQHGRPGPIEVAVEVNRQPASIVRFTKNDNSFGEEATEVGFRRGWNLLGICLAEDPLGTTGPPNALIDWIGISIVEPS